MPPGKQNFSILHWFFMDFCPFFAIKLFSISSHINYRWKSAAISPPRIPRTKSNFCKTGILKTQFCNRHPAFLAILEISFGNLRRFLGDRATLGGQRTRDRYVTLLPFFDNIESSPGRPKTFLFWKKTKNRELEIVEDDGTSAKRKLVLRTATVVGPRSVLPGPKMNGPADRRAAYGVIVS